MAECSIPVDVLNPGQVFACLGLLEAADVLIGNAEGRFDWISVDVEFVLRSDGEASPVDTVLEFLSRATVEAIAPAATELRDGYGSETIAAPSGVAPCAVGDLKESALPVVLRCPGQPVLRVSHWADSGSGRDAFKLWGGAGGYSGAARTRDLQTAFIELWKTNREAVSAAPFDAPAELSNGFRLEMRRDYVPLDTGFSLNAHSSSRLAIVGFPAVELLAAIGLEYARPRRATRLRYSYGAWPEFLPPTLARPVIGAMSLGFSERIFSMTLGEPNDYDRSILFSREETVR